MAFNQENWHPKAIIFDLLTGLINSWSLWDASTPSGTSEEGRRWRQRYLQITFSGSGAYAPYEDFVRQAANEVGLPPTAPESLLGAWGSLQAWPEAGAVLRDLKNRGYSLGVVTNCSKELGNLAARRVERAVGEEFSFDTVITAEESGFYKPLRQAYEAILTAMDVKPEDVLFVAGSAGDVQGATNAGMKVVWHNHVGLANVGEAVALREGKTLDETLKDFL